jgi:hypothetical protein
MSGASDRNVTARREIPKVGFGRGERPPDGEQWLNDLKVGDVLVDAVRRRHVVRKVFKGGLRIDFNGLGPQDWGWHALLTLAAVPAEAVNAVSAEAGAPPPDAEPFPAVALGARFQSALDYAYEVHSQQRRKGPEPRVPYHGHVLGVCSIVIDDGGTEDEAIAALLHDAAEDADGQDTLEIIRRRFGKKVARLVELCSDTTDIPKPPWRERKLAFIDRLAKKRTPAGLLRVIAADKLHNVRALLDDYRRVGDELWTRFETRSATDQLWYYGEVTEIMLERMPGPLSYELDRTLTTLGWFVACGGVAQASAPIGLDWHGSDSYCMAIGRNGTKWEIAKTAAGQYGITIAEWDRPDWHTDTLDDAKQLCLEMEKRPPFWRELMVTDWLPPHD